MKTKFLKLILPMLLIVLAVTSAFSTLENAKDDKAFATIPYEMHVGLAIPCVVKSQSCSLITSGTYCRVGQLPSNPRLWEKDEDGNCTIALFKP